MITELNQRSQDIFRYIVDAYLKTGAPVGSGTIARDTGLTVSSATIRNVMMDLEEMGLIYAPHISAGRLPTQAGLRFFVDGLMEVNQMDKGELSRISKDLESFQGDEASLYDLTSQTLSGLSAGAGLVVAPKGNKALTQIQFVNLGPGRVLVVLVGEDGMVENRVMEIGHDIPPASLVNASNYLSAHIIGKTMEEARTNMMKEIEDKQTQLDALAEDLVSRGLTSALGSPKRDGFYIVRGQGKLLENVKDIEDLERLRHLFDLLENKETMLKLLSSAQEADGVQIYIGSENTMFSHAGLSMVLSPTRNRSKEIVGAIGVIGPTRLNYGRVVPVVDYTAQLLQRLIG